MRVSGHIFMLGERKCRFKKSVEEEKNEEWRGILKSPRIIDEILFISPSTSLKNVREGWPGGR